MPNLRPIADFFRTVLAVPSGASPSVAAGTANSGASPSMLDGSLMPWGGVALPLKDFLATHFAVIGMTLSAKTLSIRMLMNAALIPNGRKLRHRAFVYDPKLDFYPVLRGMGVPASQVIVLNPFDSRSVAWDIAADINDAATARQFSALLAPVEPEASQPFFSSAAQGLLEAVINTLRVRTPKRWTFNDALEAFYSLDDLRALLSFTDDGRRAAERYLGGNEKTASDVLSTVDTKLMPYTIVARLWARAKTRVSLTEWATSLNPTVLLLGRSDTHSDVLDPINRAFFKRLSQLVTARPEVPGRPDDEPEDKTWVFVDETRWAGDLDGLDGLLLKGRSKGAHVVLGFQDIQGMRHVYGKERADELVGQCGNLAVMRLNSPETMEWAAEFFGKYEEYVQSFNFSQTKAVGGSSTTTGHGFNLQERSSILAQQFRMFAMPSRERGIEGAFAVPEKAWTCTVPSAFVSQYLRGLSSHKDDAGFVPRAPEDQERLPWSDPFRNDLGLDKPQQKKPPLRSKQTQLREIRFS